MSSGNRHVPVLLEETLGALSPVASKQESVIADGTFGGGGHTAEILKRFPHTTVVGCDFDENAIAAGRTRLAEFFESGRLRFFHGNFKDLPVVEGGFDGILVDLGYSSNQLEDPFYGMSFQNDAPLDMRLARPATGPSAWDVLTSTNDVQLENLLRAYGEIHQARFLAKNIHAAIERGEIVNSTLSLASWMEKKFPRRGRQSVHPATLVFQALRIAVNDELRSLDVFLKGAILKLKAKGRLLVITFHSLEDRIVKKTCANSTELRAITKKPIVATEAECNENPRSRSAKLRVYERV